MSRQVPDQLYKYLDPHGACTAIESGTLRWSAPDIWNDPFELNRNSSIPFEMKSLLDSTIKLASSMIFAPDQPKGDSPLINAIKRWREESRFGNAEEAHGVLRELLSKMVDHRTETLTESLEKWQTFVRNTRLCCFCAKPDIIPAWDAFAGKHTGVALRFETSSGPFDSAQPIAYQTERPQLTTIREQLGSILHNKKDGMISRFKELHLVKPAFHKPEQEWRCQQTASYSVPNDDNEPENWYEDILFPMEALSGVYFGVACTDQTRMKMISMVKEQAPECKFYTTSLGKTAFNLDQERYAK